ncbi:hypothetical protein [Flavobacterium laiguense]|uniref:Uncharacterized protein n=1 Tax=Flavobacterium laiguense TaxID=2169409 RepID=A0A2U1JXH7_9FLAO|nr:hypothetical protein [Flavobacterium laiguense]PWA09508.1 hypothetical protein DB891_07440 [Flavobacterium laiguense]
MKVEVSQKGKTHKSHYQTMFEFYQKFFKASSWAAANAFKKDHEITLQNASTGKGIYNTLPATYKRQFKFELLALRNALKEFNTNYNQYGEMKNQGLKKPSVRGLKTLCSHVVKATGLKVDGTLKKGFKYIKGGKVVKTTPTPSKTKKVCAKKTVAKKPATKKNVAKKNPVAKKSIAKTKK